MMNYLLIYDISEDRIRNKIASACKDYGLRRVQFSAFFGPLNRNYLEELEMKMRRLLNDANGSVIIFPLGKDALENVRKLESEDFLYKAEVL